MGEPCLVVADGVAFPPGCRPGPSTVWLARRRRRVEYEQRKGKCIVHEPVKAVLPAGVCAYLDKASAGERFSLLMLGPPGTGKSITLELLKELWPAEVVDLAPEEILNSYVGETEKQLLDAIRRAESMYSLLAIDEADLLLEKRSGGGGESGYSRITSNLVRILLRKLQEWSNTGRGPAVAATSNKPSSDIDPALVRGGRFTTIVFPPPSADDVLILAELYGVDLPREKAEELAALSPTFSNIVEALKAGEPPREYKPVPGIRLVAGPRVKPDKAASRYKWVDLVIAEELPLGCALAASLSVSLYGRPLVMVVEPQRLEEAIWIARGMGAPVGIPYNQVFQAQVPTMYNEPVVRFFCGAAWSIEAPRLDYKAVERLLPGLEDEAGCEPGDDPRTCLVKASRLYATPPGVE